MNEWREVALCRQTDPEAFFPLPNADASAAVAVCRRCPVQSECLAEALDQREEFGIWGGMTEQERRALRRAVTA